MFCIKCSHIIREQDHFCPDCGYPVGPPPRTAPSAEKRNKRIENWVLACVGLFLVAGTTITRWITEQPRQEQRETEATRQLQVERQRVLEAEEAFRKQSAEAHLAGARALLKPGASEEALERGLRHLSAIGRESPLFEEAAKLRIVYARAKRKLEQKQAEVTAAAMREMRVAMAKTMENNMLDQGLNVDVRAIGSEKTVLHIKWIFATKALVHQMSKESDFFANAKAAGFKRIEITDGYNARWYWDVR